MDSESRQLSDQLPLSEADLAPHFDALRGELLALFGIDWRTFPEDLSNEGRLVLALKRLMRVAAEGKAEVGDLRRQLTALHDDKSLLERQLGKREEHLQRLGEQLRESEARFKSQTEAYQKEARSWELRRQALENDLRRSKNEQKEKSFTVLKNSIKSGLFINAPPARPDPSPQESLLRIENKALLAQLQDVQLFKRELFAHFQTLSQHIDEAYEMRRKFLLECLQADGFEFGYFELLKHSHVPEQGFFTPENGRRLLEKMERHLQFEDLFDRFLSKRFEAYFDGLRGPFRVGGLDKHWEKLIFNDLHKIGDTVFLQVAVQNFREATVEHLRLLQLETQAHDCRSLVEEGSRAPRSLFNEFFNYRERVDRLIEEVNATVAKSEGNRLPTASAQTAD